MEDRTLGAMISVGLVVGRSRATGEAVLSLRDECWADDMLLFFIEPDEVPFVAKALREQKAGDTSRRFRCGTAELTVRTVSDGALLRYKRPYRTKHSEIYVAEDAAMDLATALEEADAENREASRWGDAGRRARDGGPACSPTTSSPSRPKAPSPGTSASTSTGAG